MNKIVIALFIMLTTSVVFARETATVHLMNIISGKDLNKDDDSEVVICPATAPILCEVNNGCCPTEYPLCGWFSGEVRCYKEE